MVDKVKFEGRDPWPAAARGAGSSLQLIDLAQDNARVSNWNDGAGWRFYSFTGIAGGSRLLLYFESSGQLYLDELRLVPGSVPGVGSNLLINGDFESPLAPAWKLQGTNGTNTAISTAQHYSGNSSLDLRFTPQGSSGQYLYQDITNIVTTATHTLEFLVLCLRRPRPICDSGSVPVSSHLQRPRSLGPVPVIAHARRDQCGGDTPSALSAGLAQ